MILREKEIGNFKKPLFIAEIGQNHNGDVKLAKELIDKAKEIGCDYVKFQCWDKDSLFINSFYENKPGDEFLKTKSLKETLDLLSLTEKQVAEFVEYCKNVGIGFSSTPVNNRFADLLLKYDIDFFKIASFDLNNTDFLKYVAAKNKPIILSTGLATLSEIETAINAIYSEGNKDIVLMHCISVYPPKDENINLNNIDLLVDYFNLPVGYSDHSVGYSIPIAAIAKGACIIEKHFTYDSSIPSGDHPISANPSDMRIIVEQGTRVWQAIGNYQRLLSEDDRILKNILRRSIIATSTIKKGEIIKKTMIDYKRPGTGIQIEEEKYILGRKAKNEIQANTLISWTDLE